CILGRAQLADVLGVVGSTGRKIELLENAAARLSPIVFTPQFFGFDQRLRSDRGEEVPKTNGLTTREVHRIRSYFFEGRTIVFLFGKVTGGKRLAGNPQMPAYQRLLVPYPRRLVLGLCKNGELQPQHTGQAQLHVRQFITRLRNYLPCLPPPGAGATNSRSILIETSSPTVSPL